MWPSRRSAAGCWTGSAPSGPAQLQGGSGSGNGAASIPQFIRADFASATREVLIGMGIVMAIAAVAALAGLNWGVQAKTETEDTADAPAAGVGELRDSPVPPGATP